MMTKEYIKQKIEKRLKEVDIEFRYLDIDNEDINLSITFDGQKYVDKLESVSLFLCYRIEQEKIITLNPRFYVFEDVDKDIVFKVLNEVNESISGKVAFDEANKCLWYVYDEKVTPDQMVKEVFEIIKLDFIVTIITTIRVILEEKENEE